MFPKVTPKDTKAWPQLQEHYQKEMKETICARCSRPIRSVFSKYSLQLDEILFDYSKNRITDKTLGLLRQLAEESKVKEAIEAMFSGERSIRPKTGPYCIPPSATCPEPPYTATGRM